MRRKYIVRKRKTAKPSHTIKKEVKTIVTRAINKKIENKQLYVNSGTSSQTTSSTPASATYTYGMTTILNQGYSEGQRIADEISMIALHIKLRLVVSNTSPDILRVLLVLWKPPTNSTNLPAVNDILYDSPAQDYLTAMSQYNEKNKQMYRVLMDKYIILDTYHPIRVMNIVKRFKGLKQHYSGSTTEAGTSHTNRVLLYIIGEGIPTNPFNVSSRFDYKDG